MFHSVVVESMTAAQQYCLSTTRRRKVLLGHFGEMFPDKCGNCDNCLSSKKERDMSREAFLLMASSSIRPSSRESVVSISIESMWLQKLFKVLQRASNEDEEKEAQYCIVCKLNHNQGSRATPRPSPLSSLFQSKLSDVIVFLKNPTSFRDEDIARNRFWCVFYEFDIDERDSSFACAFIWVLEAPGLSENLEDQAFLPGRKIVILSRERRKIIK